MARVVKGRAFSSKVEAPSNEDIIKLVEYAFEEVGIHLWWEVYADLVGSVWIICQGEYRDVSDRTQSFEADERIEVRGRPLCFCFMTTGHRVINHLDNLMKHRPRAS